MSDFEDIPHGHPSYASHIAKLNEGQCPDCGSFRFKLGPRGGVGRNIFCDICGQGFNVAPWRTDTPPHDLFFVQRIHKQTS